MKTQAIEVEGLPEGFEVNTISINAKEKVSQCFNTVQATIHLKKIQPRELRFVEITDHSDIKISDRKIDGIWFREVNETNEDLYLSLTKKDMLELIEHIKLGGQLNHKIAEFINYEQPEPKLSFSINECKYILGKFQGSVTLSVYDRLHKFIEENS